MALLLDLLLLVINVGRALSVCSPPFNPILGQCLHYTSQKMTWCEAQAYCVRKGGELITGATFLALNGTTFPGMPVGYYIGLTDLLDERGSNRDNWRWTDGSLTPNSATLAWNIDGNEPGNILNGISDCVIQCFQAGLLCDASCKEEIQWAAVPMCQPRSTVPEPQYRFHSYGVAGSFPINLTPVQFADAPCSQRIEGVRSILDCAHRCSEVVHDWCIAFYYNKVTKLCQTVYYTEAAINVGNGTNWQKYDRR